MKIRIISTVLAALMALTTLFSGAIFTSDAKLPVDRAMLLDDISVDDPSLTGGMGYIVNTKKENDFGVKRWGSDEPYPVDDVNGVSVAFDINVIAISQCSHLIGDGTYDLKHIQGLVFTFSNFSNGYQGIIYDAVKQEFQIANVLWPASAVFSDGSYVIASAPYAMKPGEWHRCFYSIQGTEVFVYCDGELILEYDFNSDPKNCISNCFLMFWESHVRMMMDNLIVGTDEYDDTLGDTFEEKVAANNNDGEDIKNVLFADDFNDAADVTLDYVEDVPTYLYETDDKGDPIEYPVYEIDGITPKLDTDGKPITEYHYKLDDNDQKIPATDEKGQPIMTKVCHYLKDGVETTDPSQEHAGFVFDIGLTKTTTNIPCRGVDKATYCGMIKDVDGAAISFGDVEAIEGETISSPITVDTSAAAFTSASNVLLSLDPIFTFKGIENIADGATVDVSDDLLVSITIPAGFSGKLGDLVLEIPAEKEMAQSCRYRFGFLPIYDTEFKNGETNVDAASVTVDGGFATTKNFIKGDANSNGRVNAGDAALILKYNVVSQAIKKSADKIPTEEQQRVLDSVLIKAADVYPDGAVNVRDATVLIETLLAKPLNTEWDTATPNPMVFKASVLQVEHGTTEAEFDLLLENVPATGASTFLVNVKVPGATIKAIKKGDVTTGTWKVGELSDEASIILVDVSKGVKTDVVFAHVTVTLPEDLKWGAELPIIVTADADPENFISFAAIGDESEPIGAVGVNGKICVEPCVHQLTHVAAVEATKESDGNIEYWKCEVCGTFFSDKDAKTEIAPKDVIVKYSDPGTGDVVPGDFNGDGKLNAKDVTGLMKAIIKGEASGNPAADFNGDGKVNAKDVIAIMKSIISGK